MKRLNKKFNQLMVWLIHKNLVFNISVEFPYWSEEDISVSCILCLTHFVGTYKSFLFKEYLLSLLFWMTHQLQITFSLPIIKCFLLVRKLWKDNTSCSKSYKDRFIIAFFSSLTRAISHCLTIPAPNWCWTCCPHLPASPGFWTSWCNMA